MMLYSFVIMLVYVSWEDNNRGGGQRREDGELKVMNYKKCTKCNQEFPATNEYFRKGSSTSKTGLYSWCRACERQNYKDNIEHMHEKHRRWRINNPEKRKQKTKRLRVRKIKEKQTTNTHKEFSPTGITPKNFIDLTGQKFGRLTVIRRASKIGEKRTTWLCLCECGKEKPIDSQSLKSGKTKSCGCLCSETMFKRQYKHGFGNDRLWGIWKHMIGRCHEPSAYNYKRYGGRGISVCDEWQNNYPAFKEWALSNGYRDDLTIDRKDNDGNYEPSNCRWATKMEQDYNKRNTVKIEIDGEIKNLKEWSELSGLLRSTIYYRFKRGWKGKDIIKPKGI